MARLPLDASGRRPTATAGSSGLTGTPPLSVGALVAMQRCAGNKAATQALAVQRTPQEAIDALAEDETTGAWLPGSGLTAASTWPQIYAQLVAHHERGPVIDEIRRLYYKDNEAALPTYTLDAATYPTIAMHTREYIETYGTDGVIILRYLRNRLLPNTPVNVALAHMAPNVTTVRDKNRHHSQGRGLDLLTPELTQGGQIDEFPPASTYEGGQDASRYRVPASENAGHGGSLGAFYTNNGFRDGWTFRYRVG